MMLKKTQNLILKNNKAVIIRNKRNILESVINMGLWGKLFGSDEYNAKEPQGHLKTKRYKRLDWEIDSNEYRKQDFIASSEYVIPSDQMILEILKELENGADKSSKCSVQN